MQQVQLWLLLLALSPSFILASGVFTCTGGLLSIIAHPDDDLYFQSPMILPYVSKSNCMTTVFLTSGDNGLTTAYAESREAGNEAAYAYMAGVTDSCLFPLHQSFQIVINVEHQTPKSTPLWQARQL